jgi:hypothetical protein
VSLFGIFHFLWPIFVSLWVQGQSLKGTFNEILGRVIDDTTIELMVGIDLGSNLGEFPRIVHSRAVELELTLGL